MCVQEKYGYAPMVMVGDGATDLEARKPGGADIFIGYAHYPDAVG
jgi:phosphoserine phosphatase